MEDHRVTEIRLHPVNLGRDLAEPKKITRPVGSGGHPKTDGHPCLADPAAGAIILNRVRDISKPLGTTVAIENNVGIGTPGTNELTQAGCWHALTGRGCRV